MEGSLVPVVFCPTGAVWGRDDSPYVPMQPEEIARDVANAVSIGISAVHLHARDEHDAPTWDSKVYKKIIGLIRDSFPELVINVSTSARHWQDIEKRKDVLSLEGDFKPEIASLTLSSLNFQNTASVNTPEDIRALALEMQNRGIVPELEIFDLGMANFARRLFKEGLLPDTVPANIFFGGLFTQQPDLLSAAASINALDDRIFWNFAGLGGFSLRSIQLGLWAGGGCRVGLEDTLHLDGKDKRLATNAQLLEQAHEQLTALRLKPMSPVQYRSVLGMASAV